MTNAQPSSPIEIELHPDTGRCRATYRQLIVRAVTEVVERFERGNVHVDSRAIEKAVFLANPEEARALISGVFGIPSEQIPATFCGTPDGTTLYMVTEDIVEPILRELYPSIPWRGGVEYFECVKHEITHLAHEKWAIEQKGTSDAMGPTWFFESLAILVAGQFPTLAEEVPLEPSALRKILERSEHEKVSYTDFARVGYSLARSFDLRRMIEAAADQTLPDLLAHYTAISEKEDHR